MGPEELLLVAAERPDQVGAIDPPTAQRIAGGLVFTDQLTAGIKADPVLVEQLVHIGESSRPLAPLIRSNLPGTAPDCLGQCWC
jgi:hypothetical protein